MRLPYAAAVDRHEVESCPFSLTLGCLVRPRGSDWSATFGPPTVHLARSWVFRSFVTLWPGRLLLRSRVATEGGDASAPSAAPVEPAASCSGDVIPAPPGRRGEGTHLPPICPYPPSHWSFTASPPRGGTLYAAADSHLDCGAGGRRDDYRPPFPLPPALPCSPCPTPVSGSPPGAPSAPTGRRRWQAEGRGDGGVLGGGAPPPPFFFSLPTCPRSREQATRRLPLAGCRRPLFAM